MTILIEKQTRILEYLALNTNKQTENEIVPDFYKLLIKFTGRENTTKAEDWLDHINGIARLNKWSDTLKIEGARACVVGSARDWFFAYSFRSWADFENKFKDTFVGKTSDLEKWRQLHARIQGRSEDTSDYFLNKLRLCRNLKLPLEESKKRMLEA